MRVEASHSYVYTFLRYKGEIGRNGGSSGSGSSDQTRLAVMFGFLYCLFDAADEVTSRGQQQARPSVRPPSTTCGR